jgi:hypothetical protein
MAKFYISSTSEDLREFRAVVYKTLRQMGHDAIAMEDYVSASRRPLAKCLEDVSNSDVYVGIIAWRRGYVPEESNPEKLSMTELEYWEASKKNLPRLMFILSPATPWPKNLKDDLDRTAVLRTVVDFRNEVCSSHVVSFFETPDQLGTLVSIAVRKWEIENGVGAAIPALDDMELPAGLRVKSYVKGDHLRVKYRLGLPSAIFLTVFGAFWLGSVLGLTLALIAQSLGYELPFPNVTTSNNGGLLAPTIIMIVFSGMGIWLFTRPIAIQFNFSTGEVTVSGPGSMGKAAPQVGALSLHVDRKKKGWRSRILYNRLEFARSEVFHKKCDARDCLLPFAVALNYQLGFHSLKEFEDNKDLSE